jgi:hypothetical protein
LSTPDCINAQIASVAVSQSSLLGMMLFSRPGGEMLKGILFFLVGLVVNLYTTLVLTILWNWFATAALHTSEISFWLMYGLVLMVNLLRSPSAENPSEEKRWKVLSLMVNACVPEDKRDDLMDEVKSVQSEKWIDLGVFMFSQVVGDTVALGVGAAIHVLASV